MLFQIVYRSSSAAARMPRLIWWCRGHPVPCLVEQAVMAGPPLLGLLACVLVVSPPASTSTAATHLQPSAVPLLVVSEACFYPLDMEYVEKELTAYNLTFDILPDDGKINYAKGSLFINIIVNLNWNNYNLWILKLKKLNVGIFYLFFSNLINIILLYILYFVHLMNHIYLVYCINLTYLICYTYFIYLMFLLYIHIYLV